MWSTHICRSAGHHPRRNQVFPSTAGVLLMVALVTMTLKVHKYWRHCQMFPTIIPILKSVRLRCNEKKKGSPGFQICLFMLILNYYVTWKVFIQKKIFWKEAIIQRKSGGHWQYNYISVQLNRGEVKKLPKHCAHIGGWGGWQSLARCGIRGEGEGRWTDM